MNREQRRLYNKKNKTKYTKEQFEMMLAVERIKNGNFNFNDLKLPQDFVHMDNTEIAPDGTEVKLNFESLDYRCSHVDKTNEYFRNWVAEAHKNEDMVYHITREEAKNSLVCLAEDDHEVELDGKKIKAPKLLFDLYSDLLVQDKSDGVWKSVSLIEEAGDGEKYVEVKNPHEAFSNEDENDYDFEEDESEDDDDDLNM